MKPAREPRATALLPRLMPDRWGGVTVHAAMPVGHAILSDSTWQELGRTFHLSTRERQVVQAIFDDRKECAIAAALGVSRHTVNTYVRRLYRKLGVTSRPQLIVRVVGAYLAAPGGLLP